MECGSGKNLRLMKNQKHDQPVSARVWNGNKWSFIRHGRKRCKACSSSYRLSYVWKKGQKKCTMSVADLNNMPEVDPILLVESYLGFRWSYLKQLHNRAMRSAVSMAAEACTICLTWPDAAPCGDRKLDRHLLTALYTYMHMMEGNLEHVDLADPRPLAQSRDSTSNDGFYTIFRADKDDPGFDRTVKKRNVAFDGNQVLVRVLAGEAERRLKKRGRGKPRTPIPAKQANLSMKFRGTLRTWSSRVPAKSKSRCSLALPASKRVCPHVIENTKAHTYNVPLNKTEGVFGTMDMRTGEILHMGEMLNAECTPYKEIAIQCVLDMCSVGVLCHDCACQLGAFEGKYCEKVVLDGLKYKKHKCDSSRFSPVHKNNVRRMHGLNTQVVEQLWSRTNLLGPSLVKMRRDHYRLFIRSYCAWRNHYIRSGMAADVNPSLSSKQVKRRIAALTRSVSPMPVKRRPAARHS